MSATQHANPVSNLEVEFSTSCLSGKKGCVVGNRNPSWDSFQIIRQRNPLSISTHHHLVPSCLKAKYSFTFAVGMLRKGNSAKCQVLLWILRIVLDVFPLNYSQIIALNLCYWNTSLASVCVCVCVCVLVAQSCPILCDPMDCSLPGCSVHGILQARIL